MKKHLKNRKGAVLITVLVIFVFVAAIVAIIFNYNDNNVKQARHQEFQMEAYYLAQMGCDMVASALLIEDGSPSTELKKFVDDKSLKKDVYLKISKISADKTNVTSVSVTDSPDIHVNVSTESDVKSEFNEWIKITSKATLGSRLVGKDMGVITSAKTLYIKATNDGKKESIRWVDGEK